MRTTVEFDDDAARAIASLRKERGIGVSEAVNELIRRGLLHKPPRERFVQQTANLGLKVDISNIGEALAILEGEDHR